MRLYALVATLVFVWSGMVCRGTYRKIVSSNSPAAWLMGGGASVAGSPRAARVLSVLRPLGGGL